MVTNISYWNKFKWIEMKSECRINIEKRHRHRKSPQVNDGSCQMEMMTIKGNESLFLTMVQWSNIATNSSYI